MKIDKSKICAGIVLYNPDMERLNENIAAIQPQVDRVFIVDNASDELPKIQIDIVNKKNLGIAKALNQLAGLAKQNGYEWIITLDQDSVCTDGMVAALSNCISLYDNVAMVSPYILDINLETIEGHASAGLPATEFDTMVLTSGCLTNINAVYDVGGWNEAMFIDQVDHELCLLLVRAGYQIVKCNTVYLLHEVGKGVRRKFLWKTILYHNHSPFRVFYQTRNYIYMLRKFSTDFRPKPFREFWHLLMSFAVKFILEPVKFKRLLAFIRGLFAGFAFSIKRGRYL